MCLNELVGKGMGCMVLIIFIKKKLMGRKNSV